MIADWHLALGGAIALSIGVGSALAIEELLWLKRRGRLTRAAWREMLVSLSPLPPNVLVSIALSGWWVFVYTEASRLAIATVTTSLLTLPPALLLADLCYYIEHRTAHRWRPLWVLYHAVHHSSPEYTVATAYRVSFVNQFIAPLFYLPCVLLGFEPLLVVGLQVFTIHYQAWVHTRAIGRLPVLDGFLNTPANHRMHHDLAMPASGVNFGGILVIWDRLFGTYVAPREVRAFGIAGHPAPRNWRELYTLP
ncbi:MAG TPA: sterol desaturase family protein, partial [Steroidobacteraceae bacterium]|nr:sterol desaturase family protein [Steroidobacteraceae bacterium]